MSKKPNFMSVKVGGKKVSEEDKKTALDVAAAYKKRLKVESPFSRPWNYDLPLEAQSVFKAFLGTAKVVRELGTTPRAYIEAQFLGLAWTGRFPFPNQLATTNARLRFEERRLKVEHKASKKLKEDDYQIEAFAADRSRLKRLKESTGMRTKEILTMFPAKFSTKFVKYKMEKRK